MVVADLPKMDTPKTRDMVGFLAALEMEGKTLILTNGQFRFEDINSVVLPFRYYRVREQ